MTTDANIKPSAKKPGGSHTGKFLLIFVVLLVAFKWFMPRSGGAGSVVVAAPDPTPAHVLPRLPAVQVPVAADDLVDRCAGAAHEAGFLTPSCAEPFMRSCVSHQSRSEMAQFAAIGEMNHVLGSKYATCGDGSYTAAYGNAVLGKAAAADKF